MTNTIYCDDCGTDVQLERGSYNRLQVACECENRSIRVSKATPEGWR